MTDGKKLSPLSIIAVFISLAQGISTLALIQTKGEIQLYLTFFVIFFPIGIAIGFFVILVKKRRAFYAPWEYETTEHMREFDRPKPPDEDMVTKVILDKVRKAVEQSDVQDKEKVVKNVVVNLQEAYLTIDTTKILGSKGFRTLMLYDQFKTVQDLLTEIYWSIHEKVPPYSYGQTWLIKDEISGEEFEHLGSQFTRRRTDDTRSLKEVGIKPGMRLQVIPL